jgi:hypothetical protein
MSYGNINKSTVYDVERKFEHFHNTYDNVIWKDCNPFDYFVWGVSELRVNAKSHTKFKDLIQKMKEVMGPLARGTLAKASTSFRSRIKAVFTADGSLIG